MVPYSVTSIKTSAFHNCPNLALEVYQGSFAHSYAIENKIRYSLIEAPPEQFTATFDANGGAVSLAIKIVASGKPIGNLPEVTRVGYTLIGWFTEPTGGAQISASTPVTTNVTYYAQWQADAPPNQPPDNSQQTQFTVTFNANGGSVSPKTKTIASGEKLGKLPAPKRTGYKFTAWFTKKFGGAKIKAATKMPAKDVTYYAHWQIQSYKATFNANKGKIFGKAKLARSVKYKSKLGKLATPKRTGYKFKGWYIKKSGGAKITAKTKMPAKNVTYWAQWRKK
jgi:uncharacterized repeat protein (TIGR02543 family)